MLVLIIYRPPRPNNAFIQQFAVFIYGFTTKYENILFLGDFNTHVCCLSMTFSTDFMDILDSFNLTQAVH